MSDESDRRLVLLVEDDAAVRRIVLAQLRALGYAVAAVSDAPGALEVLDEGAQPDLLFTDIVLPGGMNGLDLAEAVAARRPGIRVLFTSGYGLFADEGAARRRHILQKPYLRRRLAEKLEEVWEDDPYG